MEITKMLDILRAQEEDLKFDHFTNEDALDLGILLVDEAKRQKVAVAIDIVMNGYQLFRYSFKGTSQFNTVWITRKHNTVALMQKSTLRVFAEFMDAGRDPEKDQHIDLAKFANCGGAFPIYVNGVGVVGSVAVSGLNHVEDHNFVAGGIARYLGKQTEAIDKL